jgi:hypothetical protein
MGLGGAAVVDHTIVYFIFQELSMNEISNESYAVLEKVLYAWLHRNEFRAARDSAALSFWRDGMLAQLEKIAAGDRTAITFEALEKKFNESQKSVERSMQDLRDVRNEIGRNRIAIQIDKILFEDEMGKSTVRREIHHLIRRYRSIRPHQAGFFGKLQNLISGPSEELVDTESANKVWQEIARDARLVCSSIRSLNAEIERLNRMVYPE